MCTEEAGEDGVGPEHGAAEWGAATVHAGGGVGTGLQEKFQHIGCLGLHCQVQGAAATCGLLCGAAERLEETLPRSGTISTLPRLLPRAAHRFVEVSSGLPEQSDHLRVFVDDSHMEWGVAWGQSDLCQMMGGWAWAPNATILGDGFVA